MMVKKKKKISRGVAKTKKGGALSLVFSGIAVGEILIESVIESVMEDGGSPVKRPLPVKNT